MRPFGKPKLRWNDNIKMYLQEVGWEDVDWIVLAQNMNSWRAVVNRTMNRLVPKNVGNIIDWLKN
jgi:hypothetical protein